MTRKQMTYMVTATLREIAGNVDNTTNIRPKKTSAVFDSCTIRSRTLIAIGKVVQNTHTHARTHAHTVEIPGGASGAPEGEGDGGRGYP